MQAKEIKKLVEPLIARRAVLKARKKKLIEELHMLDISIKQYNDSIDGIYTGCTVRMLDERPH